MEVKRTFDLVERYLTEFPKEDALAVKRNGVWEKFSSREFRENVDYVSQGLMKLGLKKGDKIATVSNNRPEWNFIDAGMAQLGIVHVPIYPTISETEYTHILNHSQAKLIILANKELYEKIKPVADKAKTIESIYTFDKIEGVPSWKDIAELGMKNKNEKKLEEIKETIDKDDLFSIVYTSGTTGLSKGVMLTHNNFISNVHGTKDLLPLGKNDKVISFLPLCHVLERMVNYLYQYQGCSIYYAESIDTIGENINEISPSGFVCVPRVLEKVYDKIYTKGKDLTGIKKKLFFWAIDLGLNFEFTNSWAYKKKLQIANKLIFSKWREALGGNLKVIVSGGAALQPRLARVFWAAGIKVLEGYGLTETSPVISVNQVNYPYIKFGTVGPLLETSQVKIAKDGEILFKGPNLMKGYYNDEEKTNEVIDSEGWFHTGDIGVLHEHNILQITDRKKSMFKLSTGKYVAPQGVENKFKESPFIEQLMVVGAGEKFASAIVCPAFEYLHGWCSEHNIHFRDNKDLIQNPKVISKFQTEIDILNKESDKSMQVKKFELTCQDWLPDTGELSATLKLKRKVVEKKYKIKLDRMYGYTTDDGHVGTPSNIES